MCSPPQDPRFNVDDDQSSKVRTILSIPIKNHRAEVTFMTFHLFCDYYFISFFFAQDCSIISVNIYTVLNFHKDYITQMHLLRGQVVGVVVMINKRSSCDGSASVFSSMDEKVRDG